jgi:hypothetical protein
MAKESTATLNFGCDTHCVFDKRHRLGIDPLGSFEQQLRLIEVTEDLDDRRLLAALLPGDQIVFEDRILGRGNFQRAYEQVVVLRRESDQYGCHFQSLAVFFASTRANLRSTFVDGVFKG